VKTQPKTGVPKTGAPKTGVIGLGAMGGPMARRLADAGLLAAAWNRTPERARRQFPDSPLLADSPAAVARRCELILLSLSRDQDVLAVLDALAPALRPDAIVADTSTVGPETARAAAARLRERRAHFLDCPVSGGVEGARNGALIMMAGGDPRPLERARPALSVVAAQVLHMGETGAGQATKAVNQLMAAGINQAVSEALAFGQRLGLDMERALQALAGGAAGNWFLEHRGRGMLAGSYPPGFRVALHGKDLEIAQALAAGLGFRLPVAEATLRDYRELIRQGRGDEDISALFRLKRSLCRGGAQES